ncbi:MAG: GNAT family N-acetyltransferase [Gemmatimonadaceae bacterium]
MTVVETDRLILRRMTEEDAPFMLELMNDAAFLRFIGDRGVRSIDDARAYVRNGPMASYEQFGFGLYVVEQRNDGVAAGICGLVKREALDDVDVGFAMLPSYRARGYGFEAASAMLGHARSLGLRRLAAIANPDNTVSISLLEKLGLTFQRMVRLTDDGPEIKLFARTL